MMRTMAQRVLEALLDGHRPERCIEVEVEGPPRPKERPKFDGRSGRAISRGRTRAAEGALGYRVAAAMGGRPLVGEVAVVGVFFLPDRRIRDADNLMKTAMDGATLGGAWVDDSQVTAQTALLALDRERPRTLLLIADRKPVLGRPLADPTKARRRARRRPASGRANPAFCRTKEGST